MSKSDQHLTGVQRLAKRVRNVDDRYSIMLQALRHNADGFSIKDGFPRVDRIHKLTEAQRHKIRRYYNELDILSFKLTYKLPKSELPKKLQNDEGFNLVKRASQQFKYRQKWKYAFVPYDGANKPQIIMHDGAVAFRDRQTGVVREVIELNQRALAIDPIGTVNGIADLVKGANKFRIICGNAEYQRFGDLYSIGRGIVELQNKYASGNHAWENWLFGISAYFYKRGPYGDPDRDYNKMHRRIQAARDKINMDKKAEYARARYAKKQAEKQAEFIKYVKQKAVEEYLKEHGLKIKKR